MIFRYVPQRQMLPSMCSTISARVAFLLPARSAAATAKSAVFKLLADRPPDGPDLASQPTLSRFENAVSIPDLWRLRDVFVDLFIQSFDKPPGHLTFDIDAFDDPAHGQQQLIMFHGYYEQFQYLPIAFTCAENDMATLCRPRLW